MILTFVAINRLDGSITKYEDLPSCDYLKALEKTNISAADATFTDVIKTGSSTEVTAGTEVTTSTVASATADEIPSAYVENNNVPSEYRRACRKMSSGERLISALQEFTDIINGKCSETLFSAVSSRNISDYAVDELLLQVQKLQDDGLINGEEVHRSKDELRFLSEVYALAEAFSKNIVLLNKVIEKTEEFSPACGFDIRFTWLAPENHRKLCIMGFPLEIIPAKLKAEYGLIIQEPGHQWSGSASYEEIDNFIKKAESLYGYFSDIEEYQKQCERHCAILFSNEISTEAFNERVDPSKKAFGSIKKGFFLPSKKDSLNSKQFIQWCQGQAQISNVDRNRLLGVVKVLGEKEAYRYFAKNYRHRAANSRSITRCSIFTPLVRVGRPFVSVA